MIRFLTCALAILLMFGLTTAQADTLWDIRGHFPDLEFKLTADNGQPVTETTYRGETVLAYFGYTHCADACPMTLSRLVQIFEKMGPDAKNVHVLFISIDPAHDNPVALRKFVSAFDAQHMTGLIGSEKETIELAQRYRTVLPVGTKGEIAHSDTIYIFDGAGHARFIATPGDSDDELINTLHSLVKEHTP